MAISVSCGEDFGGGAQGTAAGGVPSSAHAPRLERRQRKPDAWSRVLRGLAFLVYPILIINLFIFAAIAGEAQKHEVVAQMRQPAPGMAPAFAAQNAAMARMAMQNFCGWINLYAFLPIMTAGLVVGIGGLFLSRKRARRRSDYKFQNQLILILLSVTGLVIYLAVPW